LVEKPVGADNHSTPPRQLAFPKASPFPSSKWKEGKVDAMCLPKTPAPPKIAPGSQTREIRWALPLGFETDAMKREGGSGEVPDISRGDLSRREIALTFDGGRWANAAPEILHTLRERGISSTFFLTGEFIRNYPDLVRQMVADGHEVANHTFHHPHLTSFALNDRQNLLNGVDREFLWQELQRTEEVFSEVTGRRMAPFWRAPYGEQNPTLRRWAKEAGYQHVSWTSDLERKKTLDSLDWVADPSLRIYCSAEEVRDRILGYGEGANGGIVLMHLSTARTHDRVHERLGEIIDGLRGNGYRLVKVSEMLVGKEDEDQM
jgi:peptidoglycan/xylan/chitin deacetylase (PgdA/CDA1 family)